jgi:dihydroneopterin aldolase
MADENNLLRLEERSPRPRQNAPLDKIFVRDLVMECFIGAFEEEKGIRQRVRFSVEMWIYPSRRRMQDELNSAVNYDLIVNAIEAATSSGHVQLVETLAERVASKCLSHKRAARVRICVEKLDRLEGASLGVEIERSKFPAGS